MSLNSNPSFVANQIREQLGWEQPNDFTLEEVANSMGICIRNNSKIKSEGRIVMKDGMGVISIREDIVQPGKRNFIIAHEIAHFCLHKSLLAVFSETHKTLSEWYKNGPQEKEANEFASAFLMPKELFVTKISGQKLNIDLIKSIATFFNVSMTAAFLRYMHIGKYPLMIIFIENGIIKWKQESSDFPFPYLPYPAKVPAYTVAGDFFNRRRIEERPERVDAIEWFPEDFNCQKNPNSKIWEQCYKVSENGLISCLWV